MFTRLFILGAAAVALSACSMGNMHHVNNDGYVQNGQAYGYNHLHPFFGPNGETMYYCPPYDAQMASC